MAKISKAAAVYLPQKFVGSDGTRCGTCRDFISSTHECVITDDPKVHPLRGTCTQYVYGIPHLYSNPLRLLPKSVVGYIEGEEVPTFCGKCRHYVTPGARSSECEGVEGIVQFGGCCNLYEAKEEK